MPKKIVEAALFVADRPLRVEELARVSGQNIALVRKIVEELCKDYADGRALEVVETPEGWHMRVKQDILPTVAHLTPHSDLTEGCKRTLALVLYNEPVKQSDIIKTQGNKAYSYIKKLEKKGLVKAVKKGHTMMLELTQEFENYFGERKDHLKERMHEEMKELDHDEFAIVEEAKAKPAKKERTVDDIVSDLKKTTESIYGSDDDEEPEVQEATTAKPEAKKSVPKEKPVEAVKQDSGPKETRTKDGKSLVWIRKK